MSAAVSSSPAASAAAIAPFCRVRDHFVKKPVIRNSEQEATSRFGITDFPEPLDYAVIEDMADAMVTLAPIASSCEMVVSIADRCCGALAHAVALRCSTKATADEATASAAPLAAAAPSAVSSAATSMPYTLANWYPMGSPGEIAIGHCAGFSGDGVVYLNGLKKGKTVAVVVDVLKSGATVRSLVKGVLAAGCHVGCIVVGCELVEADGRATLDPSMPYFPVVRINVRGEQTKEAPDAEGKTLPPTPANMLSRYSAAAASLSTTATDAAAGVNTVRGGKARVAQIKGMSAAELKAKTERVHSAFVGIPIVRNEELDAYPYSFFNLTDFTPAMDPLWVEDLADLCVYHGAFEDDRQCDVVVSECDRGGGPMIQAICVRVDRPYVLANWYPSVDGCGMSSHVQIGFSGQGNIIVNGLKAGDRCIIIDDMLSSGGTCEGIVSSIARLGAIPTSAIFASEKLYPPTTTTTSSSSSAAVLPYRKGAARLRKSFPYLQLISICQFMADGDRTTAPTTWVGDDALLATE